MQQSTNCKYNYQFNFLSPCKSGWVFSMLCLTTTFLQVRNFCGLATHYYFQLYSHNKTTHFDILYSFCVWQKHRKSATLSKDASVYISFYKCTSASESQVACIFIQYNITWITLLSLKVIQNSYGFLKQKLY